MLKRSLISLGITLIMICNSIVANAEGDLALATITDKTFTKDAPITPFSASASGGTGPYTFTSTTLPTGLTLDHETGEITGTNFSELMGKGAHLIISLTAPEQPPSGFPLIPVINIATNSPLHSAISADFDLTDSSSITELISLIEKVANGEKTKAEVLDNGEIMAPRVVRSV